MIATKNRSFQNSVSLFEILPPCQTFLGFSNLFLGRLGRLERRDDCFDESEIRSHSAKGL